MNQTQTLSFPKIVNQCIPVACGAKNAPGDCRTTAEPLQARSIQTLLSTVSLHNASYSLFDSMKTKKKKKLKDNIEKGTKSTKFSFYQEYLLQQEHSKAEHFHTDFLLPFNQFQSREKKTHSSFYSYKEVSLPLRVLVIRIPPNAMLMNSNDHFGHVERKGCSQRGHD